MSYLPHHREQEELEEYRRQSNAISTAFCLAVLFITIGVICWAFADGFDKTARNAEVYYGKPATVTYEKPAAYRLQSPTPEQMDHLHHIQRVAEVTQ